MNTYARPARPRPSVDRALSQLARGRLPECPGCQHPVMGHVHDEEGRRVCTRVGPVSCRVCAEVQARMTAPALAVFCLAQALQLAARPDSWKTLVLT
jgi:hypothetical protein